MATISPTSLSNLWYCDSDLVYQRLEDDAGRLFSNTENMLEVWKSSGNQFVKFRFEDPEKLDSHWQETEEDDQIFYVIRQRNTWSRFRINEHTFKRLLAHLNVFPLFMGTVHAFGYRSKDDNSTWDNFHWRQSHKESSCFEICYTVRFFEENNRGTGDPWSLRQTGIYQRLDVLTETSRLIFLQPSAYLEKRVQAKLQSLAQDNAFRPLRNLLIHVVILSATLVNLHNYIAAQTTELEKLEEKTTFSKADYLDKNDYILRFSDRQSLQTLRRHLLKTARLLDSSVHLGERLKMFFTHPTMCELHLPNSILIHEFEDYVYEINYCRDVVADLLLRTTDTCELLTSILQYRSGTSALNGTNTLVRIATQNEKEGKLLQRTSVNATSLTFAATIYLPASLLSAIFSSNLVDVKNEHFVIAHDFWKFMVILVPMTIGTFLVVAFSQWYWLRTLKEPLSDTTPVGNKITV